jgi:hypothetical protein
MQFYTNAHAFYCGVDRHAIVPRVCPRCRRERTAPPRELRDARGPSCGHRSPSVRRRCSADQRATRNLLRRRLHFLRRRAQLLAHLQILNRQVGLPPYTRKLP